MSGEPPVVIDVATTAAERLDAERFWYDVYVREVGRAQPMADHLAGTVTDRLQPRSRIIVARETETGRCVGTVRTNFIRDGGADDYAELYGIAFEGRVERSSTSITTRLMVATPYRKGGLALRLVKAVYGLGLESGIDTDFIDCNRHLVRFFTRLGYEDLREAQHPWYGDVRVLRLWLRDEHLLSRLSADAPVIGADMTGALA